jgi:hypothetical protein
MAAHWDRWGISTSQDYVRRLSALIALQLPMTTALRRRLEALR